MRQGVEERERQTERQIRSLVDMLLEHVQEKDVKGGGLECCDEDCSLNGLFEV